MLRKTTKLIHDLRIFLFAFILVSFLQVIGINPISIKNYISPGTSNAEQVGASASIAVNSVNTLAKQLKDKESALVAREDALEKMEKNMFSPVYLLRNKLILFMFFGIVTLFVLLILNFYFDLKRKRRLERIRKEKSGQS